MAQYVEVNGQTIEFPDGMAAPAIEAAIKKNYLSIAPAAVTAPKPSLKDEGYDKVMNYSGKDAIGGQLRGAGSIGSTLLAPIDAAARFFNGGKPINIGGYDIVGQDRRQGMDAGLDSLGVNRESMAFGANKLGAEIMGTAGTGGLLGNAVARIPGAAAALPSLLPAIKSAGMTAGATTGSANLAARAAGGAVTGGATAGLVNPEDAGLGLLFGAATPVVAKTMGAAGSYLGRPATGGANATTMLTAREGINAGYIVPPNMVQPSFKNQVIESVSGKQATQQIASMKNSDITEGLVRKSLGLADDIPLTQGTMESLRKTAGKAYADVSALSPMAAADLEALKVARNESQGWFKAYNRSARPDDLAQAKAFKAQADALETALEGHATAAGNTSLIPDLREARKAIAKTYTVGRALNDATGTVDARILGRMSEKGLPLSDGLDVAGKFASAFPTITKSPMQVGSPAAHNLKSMASMAMGGGGFAALGPFGAAAAAVPFIAPPLARSIMFSKSAQQKLLADPKAASFLRGLLDDSGQELAPLMYRSSGLLAGNR